MGSCTETWRRRGVWQSRRGRQALGGNGTYKTTNFLGFSDSTGSRAKQMTKQAAAARLQTAKIINRSQRLTNKQITPRWSASCSPNEGWRAGNSVHMGTETCPHASLQGPREASRRMGKGRVGKMQEGNPVTHKPTSLHLPLSCSPQAEAHQSFPSSGVGHIRGPGKG